MQRRLILAAALLLLGAFGSAAALPAAAQSAIVQVAASESSTFAIKNMTCALCPVTVKKAMEGVAGVKSVKVDFGAKTATVVFDPSITTADIIAAASTDAGYPASVEG